MGKSHRKVKSIFVALIIAIALAVSLTCPVWGALELTGTATHTSTMHPGGQFSLTGYFYYSNNTTTSVTCDRLGFSCQNLSNNSLTVDTAVFNAYNGIGTGNNNQTTGDYQQDPYFAGVAAGQLVLHTTPSWGVFAGVSPTYLKYGNAAIFEMGAGFTEYDCASHQVWCNVNSFTTNP